MKNTPDTAANAAATEERFAGQMTYRSAIARRDTALGLPEQSTESPLDARTSAAIDEMPTMLEPPPVAAPTMSINDLDSLSEPVFPPVGWLDEGPTGSLADHPLLRGLLLELPPKGTVPSAGWLDRWFDAARSILDLLYLQNSPHGKRL